MPRQAELAPQIEQFIHDNPQGVLTSFDGGARGELPPFEGLVIDVAALLG